MKEEIRGEIAIFVSAIFFALGSVLVKMGSEYFAGVFLAFARFAIALILGVIILLIKRQGFKLYDRKYLLLRGIFGAGSMITVFLSIQYIGVGRAVLLNTMYPIFGAIIGFLFFKDKISINTIIALILSIGGAVFVFYDGSSSNILGDILGLLSAVLGGISIHYVKRARNNNNSVVVYLAACAVGLIITAFSVPAAVPIFANINWQVVLILIGMGTAIFIAQSVMGYGFKYVPTIKAAIITFLKVPLTIVMGYFLLGEMLKPKFIIGATLIIIGLVINSIKFRQQVKK